MKTLIAIFMMMGMVAVSGCWSTSSNKGGTVSVDESFSITVPSSVTVKQGDKAEATVSLNRGAYFKRDVQLDLKVNGISLTPANVLVKASDKAEVKVQISVPKTAAIGEYRVSVLGTPATGQPASTTFTINVVSP